MAEESSRLLQGPSRRRRAARVGALVTGLVGLVVVLGVRLEGSEAEEEEGDVEELRGTVRAACANNDDDGRFDAFCPPHDWKAWCRFPTVDTSHLASLCPEACENRETAWSMVCAWEAVARLDEVCNGTFVPSPPRQGLDLPYEPHSPFFAPAGHRSDRLYPCDAHAVCLACFQSTTTQANCETVAHHYGGFGSADRAHRNVYSRYGFTGAQAAFLAISELAFWCDPQTRALLRADPLS